MSARRIFLAVLAVGLLSLTPAGPAQATPALKIVKIYYDSPGTDNHTNTSINGEYAVIKNMTSTARSLKGWTVRDAANHIYTFGSITLGGGKSVILRTGKGTNTTTTRYWQQTNYVWNNDTDKGLLKSPSGTLVHTCAYNSTAVDYKTC